MRLFIQKQNDGCSGIAHIPFVWYRSFLAVPCSVIWASAQPSSTGRAYPSPRANRLPLASIWDPAGKLNPQAAAAEDATEICFTGTGRLACALCSHGKIGEFEMLSVGNAEDTRWACFNIPTLNTLYPSEQAASQNHIWNYETIWYILALKGKRENLNNMF